MIGARRRTWPDFFPPCNSTTLEEEEEVGNSSSIISITNTNHSSELLVEGGGMMSTGSCPSWSLNSFNAICPPSPSPKCSSLLSPPALSIISCSSPVPSDQDIFYSQVSTDYYSSPRNCKSPCAMGTDEIEEDQMNNVSNLCKGEDVLLKQEHSSNCNTSLRYSSEYHRSMEPCLPLVGMPLLVVTEEQVSDQDQDHDHDPNISHKDHSDSANSPIYGHHRLMNRPKPYHAFLDEIKKKELDDQINAWKEAKHLRFMNKLRKKESAINAWELRQTQKAKFEMKKMESKLEKKRAKSMKKMHKALNNTRRKADEKRARERRSTVSKISMISRIADKVRDTGNQIWLKLCIC